MLRLARQLQPPDSARASSVFSRGEGLREEAKILIEYVRRSRRLVAELRGGSVRSVYGVFNYSREQAERLVEAAKSIVSVLERVERRVFGDA